MGLFYKRPLCFFSFLFLLCSFAGWFLTELCLWLGIALFAVTLGILLLILFRQKERRVRRVYLALCLGFALTALVHSCVTVTLPKQKALSYVGEREVLAELVSEEARYDDASVWSVTVRQIDGERVKIPATLRCSFDAELAPKDEVILATDVKGFSTEGGGCDRYGNLLSLDWRDSEQGMVRRSSQGVSIGEVLFSDSGLRILSERCQASIRTKLTEWLGQEEGALAAAFFVGDRSEVSATAVRDFRRSGTSHLMAVSGLHFSILLGALELLLRKLYCPKKGRLIFATVGSLFFLFLCGFSMSACRSALMLFSVYFYYLLYEENDSITALFVSLAIIVLISPTAIADMGLWMSFLATLGLLTLYPILWKKLPRPQCHSKLLKVFVRLLYSVISILLITVIANLFLLPVLWIFFGEISLVSLISNLVLSPISSVFLLGIPLGLLLSPIPWVGQGISICLGGLARIILWLIGFFSRIPSATLSLQYDFCLVLVPLFSLGMISVLVLRLRRKWLMLLPPVGFAVAFCVCFLVVGELDARPKVTYATDGYHNEYLWVSEGQEVSFCDLSSGDVWFYDDLLGQFSESTATELRSVLLTHYHARHTTVLGRLLREVRVQTLYLPTPNPEEAEISKELWTIAKESGTEVVFYGTELIALTDSVRVAVDVSPTDNHAISLCLIGKTRMMSYVTGTYLKICDEVRAEQWLDRSETILVGSHGGIAEEYRGIERTGVIQNIFYTDEALGKHRPLTAQNADIYVAHREVREFTWTVELP